MLKSSAMALVAILLGCAGCQVSAHRSTQDWQDVMYMRPDGRETIGCQGHPLRNLCGTSDGLPHLYYDCSNDDFNCITDGLNVMAVPKAGATLGQKYSVFAANLTVERCFEEEATCEVALISSRCADPEICGCGLPGTTLFYFSRSRGVIAYYPVADGIAEAGIDAKMLSEIAPLITSVLVAEQGFLRAPLALEPTRLGAHCKR